MFCRVGVLVRLACFFLAELLSLYLIHGPPLIHIETEATIRFLCSLFFFCIPFLVWAEFVSNRENGFIKFTALAQCSLVAIVFFKYLVGPSLIGILSYRAQNLFLTIFAVFLSFIVAQLWVAGKGRTREASLGARFWLQHSSIPLVVICSVITTVVHRSYPVIPRWNLEWVMGTPRIQEEGLNLDLEVFSEGIEIRDPMMFFDAPDETASFCILTRRGLILGLWDNGGEVVSRELLDLRDTIGELEMELGALSAAFGPKEFRSDGERYRHLVVYVAYREGERFRNQLLSYEVEIPSLAVKLESRLVLIDQLDPTAMHNGGGLEFGPDGYLYLGLGDGGPENDGSGFSQEISKGLFSGILRIDIYGDDLERVKPIENQPEDGETSNYWIPRDNPFVGIPNALHEFWAIGLRNPFRFSFLPSGELIVGDVGQSFYEEINVVKGGANCEWSFREGLLPSKLSRHGGKPPLKLFGTSTMPVYWYRNSLRRGCVIGGSLYQGDHFEELFDQYLFGDALSGEIFALSLFSSEAEPRLPVPVLSTSGGSNRALMRLTDVYVYGDEILFCRLGSGKGGQTLFRLTQGLNGSSFDTASLEVDVYENFEAFCSRCHGASGTPPQTNLALGLPMARDFADAKWQAEVSDQQIAGAIRDGVEKNGNLLMPAWSEVLDEASIQALVQLIREFGEN